VEIECSRLLSNWVHVFSLTVHPGVGVEGYIKNDMY